jgi:hypothetical protein
MLILTDAMPREVALGEVFTDVREWMAALVLLRDHGRAPNVSPGDDNPSRRFVKDVRRLNRGWEPGEIPRVPSRQRPRMPQSIVHAPERRENVARPRERRPATRRQARAPTSDDPSPPESDPAPVEVWRGVEAASVRMVQRCERRRAKLAAP